MATTSEHIDNNEKKKEEEEEESKKSQSTSGEQGDQTTANIDDLNQIGNANTLSSVQSPDANNKLETSDTNTDKKKNEEQTIETTQQKEESESTSVFSPSTTHIKTEETTITVTSSNSNNNEDSTKDQSTIVTSDDKSSSSQFASNQEKNNAFSIEKGDEQFLTDFQRQKAKYFFNVNLDIENKEYVTWEDVEFYLLFHITAAGKEGSDGGDLEARLSRAARAFWEHVHDQLPLPDGKRDTLTLNQFLDTWASLIDYVVKTNRLPPILQDLVKLGFELYSTDNGEGKSPTIQPQAFDQLFQKMNLVRPFAIMAFKHLTDNGTKPLDADKIDSIVKAVVTSSDDEHDSHFLLPGFFKTISSNQNNEKDNQNKSSSPPPVPEKEQSEGTDKPTLATEPSSPPPSTSTSPPQPQQSNTPSSPPPPQEQQKPPEPSALPQNGPSSSPPQEKKPDSPPSSQTQTSSTSQNGVIKSPTSAPPTNQQQNVPPSLPKPQKALIQQEDENIRHLLRYYHIDDGDIVEVAGGSVQRLVLVHPERPLPPYIQQNKQLLQKLQSDSTIISSVQQNGFALSNNNNNNNNNDKISQKTKPKITLEERVFRGEVQKGPTVPLHQEQKQENSSSTGVRQVYPQLSAAQQEEQRKQAKLQATQPEKPTAEETSVANEVSLSSKQDEKKQSKNVTHDDEEKIIAAVLKQLAPIVEKRVAAELRRIQSGETDQDEDDDAIPFPFMLGGGFPFFAAPRGGPPQGSEEQQQQQTFQQNAPGQGEQQINAPRGANFGGAGMFPPQFIMAMMNDLARGGMSGEMPGFPPNMQPPPHGSAGVEGFMMFVDDDQLMGGPPGYPPPHPGPRF